MDPTQTVQAGSKGGKGGKGGKSGGRSPLAVILEPTRDLAEQTYNCMVAMLFETHQTDRAHGSGVYEHLYNKS